MNKTAEIRLTIDIDGLLPRTAGQRIAESLREVGFMASAGTHHMPSWSELTNGEMHFQIIEDEE